MDARLDDGDRRNRSSHRDGRFSLTNVPPGTYELRIWHETYKSPTQKVTVVAGQTADIAVQMK